MTQAPPSRSERTKAAIHAAAEALFLEHGFEGVSMDGIAERAGITKQTVYSHVGNKEALFLDLVDRMTGGAGDALTVAAPQPDAATPPEAFLTRFADSVTVIHRRDGEDAVLMGRDYYNSLQETLYLLGNPANAKALFKAIAQDKTGLAQERQLLGAGE